jgi:TolB-like protein
MTLAILPFENLSRQTHLNWLSRGLQEMLASDLAKWPQLLVVSRKALGPVLREQWLQHQGFSSSDHLVGPGSLKGARYLLQGVFSTHDNLLTIHLQVIDVETGVVAGSVKTEGRETEIPNLEQDLVNQVLHVFNHSLTPSSRLNSGSIDANEQLVDQEQGAMEERRRNSHSAGHVVSSVSPQIDAFLKLEKVTHERKEAYRLAETIWQEGWLMEIGQPFNQIWHLSHPELIFVPTINIPVSLYFSPRLFNAIFEKLGQTAADRPVLLDSNVLTLSNEDSGAQQLFVEHFHKPRRIFIRARNAQGDVLALFSHWNWHTEHILHMPEFHRISVPMWPNHLISGLAHFPVAWFEGEDNQVTFDAVVLSVPDEHVLITLNPLEDPDTDGQIPPDQKWQEEDLLQALQQLITLHWTPAITEALPSPGYLPGNTRTAVGVIHLQDGKVDQVLFQNWPEDPTFMKSLEDLQARLLESCVDCEHFVHNLPSPHEGSRTFRLQLTLHKDVQSLQLGSRFQ